MRTVVLLIAVAACGRVDYDPIGGAGIDGDGGVIDGDGSVATIDGGGVGSVDRTGLLAEYLCNISLADTSGNDFDLSLVDGAEAYTDGVEGGSSCRVDGSRFDTTLTGLNASAASIDAWVRPGTNTSARTIMDIGDQTLYLGLTFDNRLICGVQTASGTASIAGDPDSVSMGTWSHVACTFSAGGELREWVDGSPGGFIGTPTNLTAAGALMTWFGNDAVSIAYRGDLDVVRVWNRELSATEVCTAAGRTDC
jgi:hypothetical protein